MVRLNSFTAGQLRSSVVGVPGADRSSQIIADALGSSVNTIANQEANRVQRQSAAEDSLAVNSVNESRDLAKLEMQQFMQESPDPATWEAGWDGIVQQQRNVFSAQNVTTNVAQNEKINQAAFEAEGKLNIQRVSTEQTVSNDIEVSGKNLIKIVSNPQSKEADIKKQKGMYTASLLRKTGMTPDVAQVQMDATMLAAEEQAVETANQIARNLAAGDPDTAIELAKQELVARNQGKTLFPTFSKMSNSDVEALKDYARTVGDENDGKSKQVSDARIIEGYGLIRNASVDKPFDIDAFLDINDLDPDTTFEDKATVNEKIKTYYSTYNSAVSTKVSTPNEAFRAMLKLRTKVKSGVKVPEGGVFTADMAFEEYKKLTKQFKINDTDNKDFLKGIEADEQSAKDVRNTKNQSVLSNRRKLVVDGIQKQPNFFGGGEIDEILVDLANEAAIEFDDEFINDTPDTFDPAAVDAKATELIQRFTLSPTQQDFVVTAFNIAGEENFKKKQTDTKAAIQKLIAEGRTNEAEILGNEAEALGILKIDEDGKITMSTESEGKKVDKKSFLDRILQAL